MEILERQDFTLDGFRRSMIESQGRQARFRPRDLPLYLTKQEGMGIKIGKETQ